MNYQPCSICGTYTDDGGLKDGKLVCHVCLDQERGVENMKSQEIIKRLENRGYEIFVGDYEYWEDIPYVLHPDGKKTFLAKSFYVMKSAAVEKNLSFTKVLQAVERKCEDVGELEDILAREKIDREAEELAKRFS